MSAFGSPSYGITVRPSGTDFDTVVEQVRAALGEQGFDTALFTSNHFVGSTAQLTRYYDHFEESLSAKAPEVSEGGLALLDALSSPWMLHLHYLDPHAGYNPPEQYLEGLEDLAPIDVDLSYDPAVRYLSSYWAELERAEQDLILEHIDPVFVVGPQEDLVGRGPTARLHVETDLLAVVAHPLHRAFSGQLHAGAPRARPRRLANAGEQLLQAHPSTSDPQPYPTVESLPRRWPRRHRPAIGDVLGSFV